MSYTFYSKQSFVFVESTPKSGVFCQFITSSYAPKSIQVQPQPTKEYSAHMDEQGTLYVAAMTGTTHLNYYILENNRFTKTNLIANTSSNYTISNPMIYTLGQTPYIVYLSQQTHSNQYAFVQENLATPQLTTLLTINTAPEQIKCFTTSDSIYIFYVTFQQHYTLNALHITSQGVKVLNFLTLSEPISDYTVCIEPHTMHLTYVTELYGKYQLFYWNFQSAQALPLATTQYPPAPVIFSYYHALWINAMINQKLHMYMSMDNGQSFSLPVPCSQQNNLRLCTFGGQSTSHLTAQSLYVSLTPSFKLCTISMIDMDHLHPDALPANELELILEGFLMASNSNRVPSPVAAPMAAVPVEAPIFHPAEPANQPSVEDAKSAFMNNDLGWDLMPRI